MNRREALGALATAGIAIPRAFGQSTEMIYRPFGKTGEKVSAIGLGGAHIGRTATPEVSTTIVRTAAIKLGGY